MLTGALAGGEGEKRLVASRPDKGDDENKQGLSEECRY